MTMIEGDAKIEIKKSWELAGSNLGSVELQSSVVSIGLRCRPVIGLFLMYRYLDPLY